jgi:hypothetical protein
MEASTPFLCIKHFLNKLALRRSLIYVINEFILTIVYFFVRVAVCPYVYYVYASQLGVAIFEVILNEVPLKCHLGSIVLFSFQLFWFRRIVENFQRSLLEIQTKTEAPTNSNF